MKRFKTRPLPSLGGILICVLVAGCGYGTVSSNAYEHAKGIYTLANMKAENALNATEQAIAENAAAGKITPREAGWLNDLCSDCRAGRWKEAQSGARKMMEDQTLLP